MTQSRFKIQDGIMATNTAANSVFMHPMRVDANTTINGDLLLVTGDFTVQGNYVIQGATVYDTDLLPAANGRSIGNSTNQFDALLRNVTVSGFLNPSANSVALGTETKRWNTYSTNVNATGTIIVQGAATLSNTLGVTGAATLANTLSVTNSVSFSNTLGVTGAATFSNTLSVSGTSTLTGNVSTQGNVAANSILLNGHAGVFANSKTVSGTTKTVIDSFSNSVGNFAKSVITVIDSSQQFHAVEILFVHTGTNALLTKYGEIYNTKLGTFDADINGAFLEISFTGTNSSATYTVKTIRQQILA